MPLLIGAMLLVIPQKESRLSIRSACAGALLGIAFYFKFPNALFLGLVAVAIWLFTVKDQRVRSILCLIVGFISVTGLESLYLALNGEFLPLWQLTASETASYVSTNYSGSFGFIQNLRTSSQALDLSWVIIAIMGWSYWVISRRHEEKDSGAIVRSFMLVLLGCLIAFFAVQLQNKGYKYHYAILLPWADLIIGAGFAHCICALSKFIRLPRWSITITIILLLLVSTYLLTSRNPLQDRFKELADIVSGQKPANGYVATDILSRIM